MKLSLYGQKQLENVKEIIENYISGKNLNKKVDFKYYLIDQKLYFYQLNSIVISKLREEGIVLIEIPILDILENIFSAKPNKQIGEVYLFVMNINF